MRSAKRRATNQFKVSSILRGRYVAFNVFNVLLARTWYFFIRLYLNVNSYSSLLLYFLQVPKSIPSALIYHIIKLWRHFLDILTAFFFFLKTWHWNCCIHGFIQRHYNYTIYWMLYLMPLIFTNWRWNWIKAIMK